VFEGLEVVRHTGQDALTAEPQRRHHVDRRVEGQVAGPDALEGIDHRGEGAPVGQGRVPVAAAVQFEPLGQG
jgi:hypothetical protein